MLHKDPWLSTFFDKGAFIYKPPFDEKFFPDGFVCAKVPVADIHTVRKLSDHSFHLVETLVEFCQTDPATAPKESCIVEEAQAADEDAVVAIAAQAFTASRFYMDPLISNDLASDIKAAWVRNYFTGDRGDAMYVARTSHGVEGFIMLIGSVIDLIAVSPAAARKGTARCMIAHVNNKHGLLRAGTQLANDASIGLYRKTGFSLDRAQYVLHRHASEQ